MSAKLGALAQRVADELLPPNNRRAVVRMRAPSRKGVLAECVTGPAGHVISVNPDLPLADFYKCLLHECAHSFLHQPKVSAPYPLLDAPPASVPNEPGYTLAQKEQEAQAWSQVETWDSWAAKYYQHYGLEAEALELRKLQALADYYHPRRVEERVRITDIINKAVSAGVAQALRNLPK